MTPLLAVQELPDMPSALLGVARGRLGDMGQGNVRQTIGEASVRACLCVAICEARACSGMPGDKGDCTAQNSVG